MPVVKSSVFTMINRRNRHGDHLPLCFTQIRPAPHRMRVQIKMGLQRLRIQAVNLQNVVNKSGRVYIFFIKLFQPAGRFTFLYYFYPTHSFKRIRMEDRDREVRNTTIFNKRTYFQKHHSLSFILIGKVILSPSPIFPPSQASQNPMRYQTLTNHDATK